MNKIALWKCWRAQPRENCPGQRTGSFAVVPHCSPGRAWKLFPSTPQLVISAKHFGGLNMFPQLALVFSKSHSWCAASGRAEVLGSTPQRASIIITEIQLAAGGQVIWGFCCSKYHLFEPHFCAVLFPTAPSARWHKAFPADALSIQETHRSASSHPAQKPGWVEGVF